MQKAAGFQIATAVRQGTEEMLEDGAID